MRSGFGESAESANMAGLEKSGKNDSVQNLLRLVGRQPNSSPTECRQARAGSGKFRQENKTEIVFDLISCFLCLA